MAPPIDLSAFFRSASPTRRLLIGGILAAVVLAVDFWIWIKPTWGLFVKALPELAEASREKNAIHEDMANRAGILSQWEKLSEDLRQKENKLIVDGEVPMVLERLSKTANASRVQITLLQPVSHATGPVETEAPAGPFEPVPIQMNAVAGTHDLGQFLSKVETGEPFVRLTDIKIFPNSTDETRHLVSLRLEAFKRK